MGEQLGLEFASGRGGARPGAGRPRVADKDRGFIAHVRRKFHRKDDPVHITVRVGKGIPSLRQELLANAVKRCLFKQRAELRERNMTHFQLVHFTIQSDHLHLIIEAPDKRGIARGVAGLEVRIARAINKLLHRKGKLWKERYHRRDLRSPTDTRNVLRYVLLNFRKHGRFLGDGVVVDPKSSASSFDGFTRPFGVVSDDFQWPVVAPRTWLLRVGWKRRGLIDPGDSPASSNAKAGNGRSSGAISTAALPH